jgi:hypothetical protein
MSLHNFLKNATHNFHSHGNNLQPPLGTHPNLIHKHFFSQIARIGKLQRLKDWIEKRFKNIEIK